MKTILQSTTNKLAKCIVGRECDLSYSMNIFFTYNPEDLDFDYRKGEWRSSIIQNIKIEEISFGCFDITITTRSSEYVFRKGEFSDKPPLTDEERLAIQMMTMV